VPNLSQHPVSERDRDRAIRFLRDAQERVLVAFLQITSIAFTDDPQDRVEEWGKTDGKAFSLLAAGSLVCERWESMHLECVAANVRLDRWRRSIELEMHAQARSDLVQAETKVLVSIFTIAHGNGQRSVLLIGTVELIQLASE
jgi:hypothetical protein